MTKRVFSCVLICLGDIGLNYDIHRDQNKYIQTHSRAFFLNSGFDLQGGAETGRRIDGETVGRRNVEARELGKRCVGAASRRDGDCW